MGSSAEGSAALASEAIGTPEGLVAKRSPHGVDETVERLRPALSARSVKVFTVIDHSGEAAGVGLAMPEAKVVIFGNPRAGTPIMLSAPAAALDLPMRVLVAADGADTVVRYVDPSWLASRYGFDEALTSNLASIHTLTDEAVAP
jgi:uncharacterized protein (DUF302 family)